MISRTSNARICSELSDISASSCKKKFQTTLVLKLSLSQNFCTHVVWTKIVWLNSQSWSKALKKFYQDQTDFVWLVKGSQVTKSQCIIDLAHFVLTYNFLSKFWAKIKNGLMKSDLWCFQKTKNDSKRFYGEDEDLDNC